MIEWDFSSSWQKHIFDKHVYYLSVLCGSGESNPGLGQALLLSYTLARLFEGIMFSCSLGLLPTHIHHHFLFLSPSLSFMFMAFQNQPFPASLIPASLHLL